jgi:outer membrane protein OmpA-like peptidoglycan-associated protein
VKNYISTIIITFILLGSGADSFAKKGLIDSLFNTLILKMADYNYEKMAYMDAIKKYEKTVKKGLANQDTYRKLAIAYFKTGQTTQAESNFRKVVSYGSYDAEDAYLLAQSLRYNKKYKESDTWIEKFAKKAPEDTRGKLQAGSFDKVQQMKAFPKYEVKEVEFNSSLSEFGPARNGDKLYFASERRVDEIINYEYAWKEAPYHDLYQVDMSGNVSRPSMLEGKVNSKFHDGPACFSADGKEIYFTRNNTLFRIISKKGEDKTNHLRIYRATINNNIVSTPEELPFNSADYSCGHPSLSSDGQTLYFASDMPGGFGGSDLYMITKNDTGWNEPVNLGGDINTEGNEMFPFIDENGTLYFTSNGHWNMGGLDLFKADKKGNGYTVKNMGYPLNSSSDDFSISVNPDGKTGYFASNREGGTGDDDLYTFKMINTEIIVQGKVLDIDSKERLSKAEVVAKNEKANVSEDEIDYKVKIKPDQPLKLTADLTEYLPFSTELDISEMNKEGEVITYDILMKKEDVWGIYGKVYYKHNNERIPEVKITITDIGVQKVEEYLTDDQGEFRIKLEKEKDYEILFAKKGIFAKRAEYSTKGRQPGWVNADEFVSLAFEKVEVNKTIEIPNIYYDLGKWNIRDDAAVELDKVVEFLTDNGDIKIELGSHTDARGSNKSNQWLSQKRAESAVSYIVKNGIDKGRITAKGYGESKLKNRCKDGVKCSETEHQENRRTEIRVTGIED